jgi:hypothetical protein
VPCDTAAPIRSCSRWGLPCRPCCQGRGALLPHRFALARGAPSRPCAGGLFSVALSLGSVSRHRFPVEPGLSSDALRHQRPSGRLARKRWATAGFDVKRWAPRPSLEKARPGHPRMRCWPLTEYHRPLSPQDPTLLPAPPDSRFLQVPHGRHAANRHRALRRSCPDRSRLRPNADAVLRKAPPIEFLAWILLAGATPLCATMLRTGIAWRDRVARQRSQPSAEQGSRDSPIHDRIDDLDTDRASVQFGVAAPIRHAGMPGTSFLRRPAQHAAVFVHHVVG